MRAFAVLAFLIGLAGAVALVVWFGAGAIAAAVAGLGWLGFLAFCLAHAPVAALLGAGWRVCLPADARASLLAVSWARVLRDAGAEVLPFSQLGGYVIGARAAVMEGVPGVEAAASTLADLTTEAVAQIAFTALGLIAIADIRPGAPIIRPTVFALVVVAALSVALALSLRRGQRLSRLGGSAAKRWLAGFGDVEKTLAALREIGARRGAVAASLALHLAGLARRRARGVAGAQADRRADLHRRRRRAGEPAVRRAQPRVLAPNALGVQEGAYALLAPLVGLDPTDALALSLIKRARDLVIGAPALLIWQRREVAQAWRRRGEPRPRDRRAGKPGGPKTLGPRFDPRLRSPAKRRAERRANSFGRADPLDAGWRAGADAAAAGKPWGTRWRLAARRGFTTSGSLNGRRGGKLVQFFGGTYRRRAIGGCFRFASFT